LCGKENEKKGSIAFRDSVNVFRDSVNVIAVAYSLMFGSA
jgi:hypothetical protein